MKAKSSTALDAALAVEEAHLEKLKRIVPRVVDVVCAQCQVSAEDLCNHDRHERVVWPRYIAMQLILELSGATYSEVGRLFSRDHTTVIYARRVLRNRLETEPAFRALYGRIREELERSKIEDWTGNSFPLPPSASRTSDHGPRTTDD